MLLFNYLLVRRFFHLFLFAAVWLHNRVPLVGPGIPGIIPLLLCVLLSVLSLLHQLLLFVIVYRMAKIVAGSLNLIQSTVFFLFILKHDLV